MTDYSCCPELIPETITHWLEEEASNEELREAIDALELLLEKSEEEKMTSYVCPFCNRDVRVTAPPNKAEEKWNTLKQLVGNYSAKVHCDADGPCSGEFKAGFDRALGWVDHKIYFLEEK